MKLYKTLLILLGCAIGFSAIGAGPVTTDLIRQRGLVSEGDSARLRAVLAKARRGEPITVAAIGGSITAGGRQTKDPANRYISRIAAWFSKTFPNAKVNFVNAGIGGSNSVYGAMRVREDVLSKKPDLVVVEYAVNDKPQPVFAESYEGVLRQLLREPQKIAVIELFFMHRKGENEQQPQVKLGRYYGLPMVSFRDAWWPEISAGKVTWESMYSDVVHPNDAGHALASDLLISVLEKANRKLAAGEAESAISTELPPPMISTVYGNCDFFQYQNLKPVANSGWTRSPDGKNWESSESYGSIDFEFAGKVLFMGFDLDKGAESVAKFSIDGAVPQVLKTEGNRPPLASNLTPGKHRIRIESAGSKVGKVRIWAIGAAGCTK